MIERREEGRSGDGEGIWLHQHHHHYQSRRENNLTRLLFPRLMPAAIDPSTQASGTDNAQVRGRGRRVKPGRVGMVDDRH